jgi:hypothetical protein
MGPIRRHEFRIALDSDTIAKSKKSVGTDSRMGDILPDLKHS